MTEHRGAVGDAGRYVAIGNPTLDHLASGARIGGSSTYAAIQARRLGWTASVAGVVGEAVHGSLVAELRRAGLDAGRILAGSVSTEFENTYDAAGDRLQQLVAAGEPIPAACLEDLAADLRSSRARPGAGVLVHLAPVWHELDGQLGAGGSLADVVRQADFVGLTPQGLLRTSGDSGTVRLGPATVSLALGRRMDAVVVGRGEADHCDSLLDEVVRDGGVAAVTDGRHGAYLWSGRQRVFVPAHQADTVDETGAGDVFAAVLFIRLALGDHVRTAGEWAAAAAALAVGSVGVTGAALAADIARLVRGSVGGDAGSTP